MKNKRMWIIIAITLVVVIAGVIAIASISGKPEPNPLESTESTIESDTENSTEADIESTTESETGTTDITIPEISSDTDESTEADEIETIAKEDIDPEDIIKPNESETGADETSVASKNGNETQKTPETAQPETVHDLTSEPTEPQGPTIVIGGTDPTEKYSCGVEGHHCEGPETHAYISNLELTGCKYCGFHNCPSFYGTDEWGNAQYTPSLCPSYAVTKDPLYYCQICGKRKGDGKNDTCVQYIQECDCPNCGKHVGSRVCHTCE